jgi:hypothetical protein
MGITRFNSVDATAQSRCDGQSRLTAGIILLVALGHSKSATRIRSMRHLFAFLATLPTPAPAWNEHGHMVVARLAWNQLTADQRAKVIAILKNHPHCTEYLSGRRPDRFAEDERVFMRAAI